ncbi:cytochrome c assembly protein [Thermincola ferriacetica]|uniref:Heme exporter protein C n=2 Tax=Thermincola TaxID=278993 RepID=D5X9Y6_THEPJ|nr:MULTISPECIES: cytochrome c biogenesis protein CcsA [Thermincola]ADG83119.1 cytochrome c assembly protein [Thermincola potens JR]KNZ70607.1 cytochrome c assembly protein [Thermincola ferriacetica]
MLAKIEQAIGVVATVLMAVAIYLVFAWVPNEKIMGPVQKIFYFHVASAWIAFFAFFVVFIASIVYLKTRNSKWDWWAAASAKIGLLFTTIVILTGPIWGKSAWGAWWTWDPRLTTTLILWFIYAGYVLVRVTVDEKEKRERFSALFGIIGFLDVPIVWFSISWWNTIHPKILNSSGMAISPKMFTTLMVSLAAFTALYGWLMPRLYRIERLEERFDRLKEEVRNYR